MEFCKQLFGLQGKVALVTGGSRGIGFMIAEGLVKAGAKVYIASRKADACAEAEAALREFGDCTAIAADVATIEGCSELAAALAERESELHILVNNAGVTWSAGIDDFHEKAWNKVVDLDLKSPFFLIQQMLPLIRNGATAENRASIVNITSVNALRPSHLQNYSYVAAKAGLTQLSVQLASDLMQDNINVNAVAPGFFLSKMTESVFETEEGEKEVLARQPMQRIGSMEDIAGLVIYLSSRPGQFITGANIVCDGGVTIVAPAA